MPSALVQVNEFEVTLERPGAGLSTGSGTVGGARVIPMEEVSRKCCTVPYHTIPNHTIPYYTTPHHTTPHHTTPHHTTPHHTATHHTTPHHTTPHHTTPHHTTPHHTTPHHTTPHHTTLHYTTLHYTTLHYTTLHYTTLHYTTPLWLSPIDDCFRQHTAQLFFRFFFRFVSFRFVSLILFFFYSFACHLGLGRQGWRGPRDQACRLLSKATTSSSRLSHTRVAKQTEVRKEKGEGGEAEAGRKGDWGGGGS